MNGNTAALLTVFLFTFLPLILAEIARNRALPTLEDFFLQGRQMPLPLVFFTVYATWVSSFAFLGVTSWFYAKGPVYMTCFAWNALFAVLFCALGERIWYYGKAYGYISPTDFFRDLYRSDLLNLLVAAIMILFTLPYLQIQLAGGAYLIEVATGGLIPWRISGLLFYLIIIIYLWAGGMRAVAMTDVFYGIFVFAAMIFTGFYLVERAGGMFDVFSRLQTEEPALLTLPGPDGDAGILLWLCMFLVVPLGAVMGPPIWLRCYAVHRRRTFRIMPFLLCLTTIEYLGPILAGAAGRVLDPRLDNPDLVIPVLLLRYAPQLLVAVLFCGIAAAALSTANSQIHATAVIYTIDIHKRYFNPGASEKQLVAVGKWAVLVISALAYLLMIRNQALIIQTGTLAMAGTAQLIVPTLGALFWKRSSAAAACAGLMSGVLMLAALFLFTALNLNYIAVLALLLNGAVFLTLSFFLPASPENRNRILHCRKDFLQHRSAP